ncbi:MFS transporter [uncultured Sphingomonas sp.]|uniref:MFS transporter n=1 Tax=uncultured Sphingomonas sp. TaxID=158754 RepID=UPI0025E876C9|nr:MFS transporter [uncultured Sphingomonas sp.]
MHEWQKVASQKEAANDPIWVLQDMQMGGWRHKIFARTCNECQDGALAVIRSPQRMGCMLRYLCAHFAKSQLWHTSGLLFAFFLTEACGLTPQAMGWVLGLTLFLNGLADLALGTKLDGRIADAATAATLQARAAPAVAACFLLFAITPLIPADWRVIWALVTLSGFRLLYPLVDVAQNALVPLMTLDTAVQRRWLAARNVVSSLAALAVVALAAPLLIAGRSALIYPFWAAIVAGAMWWTSAWTAGASWPARPAPNPLQQEGARPVDLPIILLALAAMMFTVTLFRTLEPYFTAFASHRIELMLWAAIGAPISQPLWVLWIGRHGMARVLLGMAATLLVAALLLTDPIRVSAIGGMAIGMLFGAGTSGLWLVLWAMMTQRAVPSRALRYVGTFTCMSKLAQGAAMLLVGRILARTPYSQTLADPASPPSRLMMTALVATAGVAIGLAVYRRGITRTASVGTAAKRHRPAHSIPVPDRPRSAG